MGLVPACKSLDCLSVMAACIGDVDRVVEVMMDRDDDDPWSRDRGPLHDGSDIGVGLPTVEQLEFFGDVAMRRAHLTLRDHLARRYTVVDVSLEPFLAAGALLYQGPWVTERLVEFGEFLAVRPDSIHPVVRDVLRSGQRYTAVDAFAALQSLQELKAVVGRLWMEMDVLVVPTIGTTFTVGEVRERPIGTSAALGHYTHFGNLLDLLGVALTDDLVLHLAAQLLDEPRARAAPFEIVEPSKEHA